MTVTKIKVCMRSQVGGIVFELKKETDEIYILPLLLVGYDLNLVSPAKKHHILLEETLYFKC